MEDNQEKTIDIIIKTFAFVGLISIIIIGGFGLINLHEKFPKITSNVQKNITTIAAVIQASTINDSITLTIDRKNIVTGEQFTLSWDHIGQKNNGSYSFMYDCTPQFYFLVIPFGNNVEDSRVVFCNVPFHFLNKTNSIALLPFSEENENVNIRIGISFIENGKNNTSEAETMSLIIKRQTTATLKMTDEVTKRIRKATGSFSL